MDKNSINIIDNKINGKDSAYYWEYANLLHDNSEDFKAVQYIKNALLLEIERIENNNA